MTQRPHMMPSKDKCMTNDINAVQSGSNGQYMSDRCNDNKINRRRNVQTKTVAVPKFDGYLLCVSSLLFAIPGIYATVYGVTLFMFVNFFIVTFSMNYWRHATDGIRRYLDMFMARLGFVTYIIFGAINIRSPIILYSFIPLFVPNVLCYKYACIKWEDDSEHWCYYHMGFHLFTTIEQFLILYYYVLERNGQ